MTEDKLLELLNTVASKDGSFTAKDSLFNSGSLDSMTMITFLSLVEETFSTCIFDDDFDVSKFDTIEMIKDAIGSSGDS